MLKLLSYALISLLLYQPLAEANQGSEGKTVILVRHAEKATNGRDPSLTEQGKIRAQALIETLANTPLSLAIATQYRRTQETLAPIISARQLPVTIVDAGPDLAAHIKAIVERVTQEEGNVIIAGHSNTLAPIIDALKGPKIPQLKENEYNHLYILSVPQNGPSSLIKTQYGASSAITH
ncbi:histidine phosphatase family protein [Shewanella marisflavi]|uniref:histidine phosphatase family protein n=1 Tax=Shewanella marisflavi TaxID=260364 RepID=UPI003AACCB9B